MKSEVVRIRIEPELKVKIENAAKKESRTMSNWIEQIIKKELKIEMEDKKMKETYSIHVGDLPQDDIYNGTLGECRQYIKEHYTQKEIEENNICIAKILISEDELLLETLEILPA